MLRITFTVCAISIGHKGSTRIYGLIAATVLTTKVRLSADEDNVKRSPFSMGMVLLRIHNNTRYRNESAGVEQLAYKSSVQIFFAKITSCNGIVV